MPQHTSRSIERVLVLHGFLFSRQHGSHRVFKHPETGFQTLVPYHGSNKPVTPGVFSAILKQTGIPKEAFLKK